MVCLVKDEDEESEENIVVHIFFPLFVLDLSSFQFPNTHINFSNRLKKYRIILE